MKKLSELTKNKKFQKGEGVEWKVIGSELTEYFGKNAYWILWRYPKHKIYEKFKAIKTEGKKDLAYFIGMLKK